MAAPHFERSQKETGLDTDELTERAYGLIGIAGNACDFLRSEIGASATQHKNEDEKPKTFF